MKVILHPVLFISLFLVVLPFSYAEEVTMRGEKEIALPAAEVSSAVSLEQAISKRRSQRAFADKDLNLKQLGQLLWAAQGITVERAGFALRSAPSAGALYPLEIYALTKEGLFYYLPSGHKVKVISSADLRAELARACLGQASVAQAPLDIVICAVYARSSAKYGERGIRYCHIEAGHAAENIHLQAVALSLGSVPIGAFDDQQVMKILALPAEHKPVYVIPVGYPE